MDALPPTAIAHYRQSLEQRQAALREAGDASRDATQTVALDQNRVGRLTRMDALQQQAMSHEGERRRGLELQRIASALRRIEEGNYGNCVSCGEAIDARRLEFDPAATQCIACAARREGGQ